MTPKNNYEELKKEFLGTPVNHQESNITMQLMTNKPEPASQMQLLLYNSGAMESKPSNEINKKKTKKGNESAK